MMPAIRIHEELKKLVTTLLSVFKRAGVDEQCQITKVAESARSRGGKEMGITHRM